MKDKTMPNKEQKRKITFVLTHKSAIYLGYASQMSMVPVTVVKYKNIYIKQINPGGYYPSNTICRETTIAYIIEQLLKNPQRRTINMLIVISKKRRDNLNKGTKLINHYEKLLNWNKTCIYDVDEISRTDKINEAYKEAYNKFSFVLITIPNKWLYSPQLLSLYLMFLKIAEIGFKCEFETHKELINQLDTFFAKKQTHLDGFMSGFHYRVLTSYKYWDIFLHNLDILYKNKTRKFNYNMDKHLEKRNNNFTYKIYLDGINNLVKNKTYDKQLRENFNILKKAVKNEQI